MVTKLTQQIKAGLKQIAHSQRNTELEGRFLSYAEQLVHIPNKHYAEVINYIALIDSKYPQLSIKQFFAKTLAESEERKAKNQLAPKVSSLQP